MMEEEIKNKIKDLEDNLDKLMLENRELDKRIEKLEEKNGNNTKRNSNNS